MPRKPREWKSEVRARAINAEPWEPLKGHVKRVCPDCLYYYAHPRGVAQDACPDCLSKRAKTKPRPAGWL